MSQCLFEENHKNIKNLYSHYLRCHQKEYNTCKKYEWYCRNNTSILFMNEAKKQKHLEKCQYCKNAASKEGNKIPDISTYGHEIIESKMPKEKIEIKFPIFDFDKYKRDVKKEKKDDFKDAIEKEKNILY